MKAHRGFKAETHLRETLRPKAGLKPVFSVGKDTEGEEEDSSANLQPKSRRTRGPMVIGKEETFFTEEETKGPIGDPGTATAFQPEDTPAQPEAAPFTSSIGEKERSGPKDLQPGSRSVMVPSTGFLKLNPTTKFIGTRPPVSEIPPSPSNEEVDYLGDDWDLSDDPTSLDANKSSHLTIEEGRLLLHQRRYFLLRRPLLQKVNFLLHCYLFLFII